MNPTRFLGIIVLAAGIVVLAMAYQAGGFDGLPRALQQSRWDRATWMVLIGTLATVLGLVGIFVREKHRTFLKRVFHRRERRVLGRPGL